MHIGDVVAWLARFDKKTFIVPTIGLLLQTHDTMCILHS
jgi:hypothetical protein